MCVCVCITSDSRSRFSACSVARYCCRPSLVSVCSSVSQFRRHVSSESTLSPGSNRVGGRFFYSTCCKICTLSDQLSFTINSIVPPLWWILNQSSDWLACQTGSVNLRKDRQRGGVEIQHFNAPFVCDCAFKFAHL